MQRRPARHASLSRKLLQPLCQTFTVNNILFPYYGSGKYIFLQRSIVLMHLTDFFVVQIGKRRPNGAPLCQILTLAEVIRGSHAERGSLKDSFTDADCIARLNHDL